MFERKLEIYISNELEVCATPLVPPAIRCGWLTEAAPSMFFVVTALLLVLSPAVYAETFASSAGDLKVEEVVRGLEHPWALAFLPDGSMLVSERRGRLRIAKRDGDL